MYLFASIQGSSTIQPNGSKVVSCEGLSLAVSRRRAGNDSLGIWQVAGFGGA